MRPLLVKRVRYSRAEDISDLAVHLTGLVAVIALVPALVVAASFAESEGGAVAPALLYGLCFFLMIGCSALYNTVKSPDWEWLLKRLDHSAIYLKIAGTYTAFALLAGEGVTLIAGLWVAASIGIALKIVSPHRFRTMNLILYLGMGWIAGWLGHGIFADMPEGVVTLIVLSGVLYTVGVLFYLYDRLPFHFTIWHVFVLAGSLCVYAAMARAVTA